MVQEDEKRKKNCAADSAEEHGLRRVVCASRREGVTLPHVCSRCHRYPSGDHIWWVSSEHCDSKQEGALQLVVPCVWRPVRLEESEQNLGHTESAERREAKVFRVHAPPHGVCDKLVNALQLLANRQGDDSPVDMLVEGLQERNMLKMMEEREGSRWTTTRR